MCFSAEASFIASTGIAAAGIFAIKKADKKSSFLLLAFIPILFAIQQFIEGLIWLDLQYWHNDYLRKFLIYIYLTFVYTIWPIYSSLVCLKLENNRIRQYLMLITMLIGLSLSIHAYMYLIGGNNYVSIIYHSLYYHTEPYKCPLCIAGMYMASTCLPFLLSSVRLLNLLGLLLLISAVISFIIWRLTFASVWCFFAAVLSIFIVYVVLKLREKYK